MAPCYWPEVRRGTERFTRDLADGLVAHGHRPRLITSHPHAPSRKVEDGLEVVRLPRPPQGQLTRRMYEDYLTHVPLSSAVLRMTRNDVAHALYAPDGVAAARWSARTGRPAVFSYMGIPDRPWLVKRRMRLKTTTEAARDCDAVVALSRVAADEFRRTLGVEARVINPGVDVRAFAPGGQRAERPTIFSAAALEAPHKKLDQLIAALPLVRRERPDVRLVLSRPRDPQLARQVLAGDAGIELADVDDRAALVREYRSAWVTALPSVSEPFGLVLVESMACGTPTVGRRDGAIPEVLDREAVGVLFEGGPEELARALLEGLELVGDSGTAAACRARAEQFSTDICTSRYEALYSELLAARGR